MVPALALCAVPMQAPRCPPVHRPVKSIWTQQIMQVLSMLGRRGTKLCVGILLKADSKMKSATLMTTNTLWKASVLGAASKINA